MASVIALVEIEPSNSVKSDSNALLSYPHQGRTQSQVDRAPQQLNSVPGRSSEAIEEDSRQARGGRALLLGLQMTLVMTTNSFTSGLITIGVGEMAKDLELDQSLVFWPVLAYTLTASPLLLPIGSIADVVGPRSICLAGCLGCGIFVLACGLAKNGAELIAFRCLQGVAAALFLPTSMSIISSSIASGKLRNVALATLAFGQVLGFGLGLVAGGVLLGTVGWRVGYYTCGAMQIALFFLGFWSIPSSVVSGATTTVLGMLQKLRDEIDWVGSAISCAAIGMLSYVLAMIAEDSASIKAPLNATLLALSLLAIPCFAIWMSYQEKHNRPALIPNSLWKTTFTCICIMIMFSYAEMQAMELLASLFFQNIQGLPPLQSSLRLLPGLFVATFITLSVGHFVHKLSIPWTLSTLSIVAGLSPLLMAVINPAWPYWYDAFAAQALYPVAVDIVFLTSALIISESFPERDQALAGAVFNTIANLGQSLGLAVIAVVTNAVTQGQSDAQSVQGLLEGYRAGFWTSFVWMIMAAAVGALGLRKVGKVGVKRD